jgi:hypothetical protein
MIKNEFSCTNKELGSVLRDIKNNKEFGSLFQFLVSQVLSEMQEDFGCTYGGEKSVIINYSVLYNLAIKIVNRIGQ